MSETPNFQEWLDGVIRGTTGASDTAAWPRSLVSAICKGLKSAETHDGLRHSGHDSGTGEQSPVPFSERAGTGQ